MEKIRIIGDLHLCEDTHKILSAFEDFVEECLKNRVGSLYIIGDLFDVWVGDDVVSKASVKVARTLSSAHKKGLKVYFIHGNRDFLIGKRYASLAKITLLKSKHLLHEHGIFLMHGDLLCTDDFRYQVYRFVVQSYLGKSLIESLPLSWRKRIGRKLRLHSQARNSKLSQSIMDVSSRAVNKTFLKVKVPYLVHGHTHLPNTHYEKEGIRLVVGSWELSDLEDKGVVVCEADNGECQLIYWKPENNKDIAC